MPKGEIKRFGGDGVREEKEVVALLYVFAHICKLNANFPKFWNCDVKK